MSVPKKKLQVWDANGVEGKPTCVSGSMEDGGWSLTLWRDEDGRIIGGTAYDTEDQKTLVGWGMVPWKHIKGDED